MDLLYTTQDSGHLSRCFSLNPPLTIQSEQIHIVSTMKQIASIWLNHTAQQNTASVSSNASPSSHCISVWDRWPHRVTNLLSQWNTVCGTETISKSEVISKVLILHHDKSISWCNDYVFVSRYLSALLCIPMLHYGADQTVTMNTCPTLIHCGGWKTTSRLGVEHSLGFLVTSFLNKFCSSVNAIYKHQAIVVCFWYFIFYFFLVLVSMSWSSSLFFIEISSFMITMGCKTQNFDIKVSFYKVVK